jgi:hypothetical protein
LFNIESLSDFIEKKVYMDEKFLKAYNEIYAVTNDPDEEEKRRIEELKSPENNKELYDELLKRNEELIQAIELDSTLKLNVAKELPCEVFQLQYETYRTKVCKIIPKKSLIIRDLNRFGVLFFLVCKYIKFHLI